MSLQVHVLECSCPAAMRSTTSSRWRQPRWSPRRWSFPAPPPALSWSTWRGPLMRGSMKVYKASFSRKSPHGMSLWTPPKRSPCEWGSVWTAALTISTALCSTVMAISASRAAHDTRRCNKLLKDFGTQSSLIFIGSMLVCPFRGQVFHDIISFNVWSVTYDDLSKLHTHTHTCYTPFFARLDCTNLAKEPGPPGMVRFMPIHWGPETWIFSVPTSQVSLHVRVGSLESPSWRMKRTWQERLWYLSEADATECRSISSIDGSHAPFAPFS